MQITETSILHFMASCFKIDGVSMIGKCRKSVDSAQRCR